MSRARFRFVLAVWASLAFAWLPAGPAFAAGFPTAYEPLVVRPAARTDRTEFDLGPALARAQRENKALYVYLGADDCRFCRKYEAFLASHVDELKAAFAARYLVVDLRSSLSVPARQVYFKVGDKSLPYAEFQAALGDERARLLVYPNVWLLDANARPLMQMPSGAGTFQTVPEQLEILRLDQ